MIAKRILAVVGMTVAVIATTAAAGGADGPTIIDDFESVAAWSAHPAEGVTLALSSDAGEHGKALRMDVHFTHGTGYAVARRAARAAASEPKSNPTTTVNETQKPSWGTRPMTTHLRRGGPSGGMSGRPSS